MLPVVFVDVGRQARPGVDVNSFEDGGAIHEVPQSMGHVDRPCGSQLIVVVVLVKCSTHAELKPVTSGNLAEHVAINKLILRKNSRRVGPIVCSVLYAGKRHILNLKPRQIPRRPRVAGQLVDSETRKVHTRFVRHRRGNCAIPDQRDIAVPWVKRQVRHRAAIGAKVPAEAGNRCDVKADRNQV